jgi:uncharacterized SAM-binding protein YcdF (DUF218 family)
MYEFVRRLLEPYTFLSLCLLTSAVWMWRRQRPRSRSLVVLALASVCLTLLSLPITGFLALRSLESAYPPADETPAPGDTLVVLSAGMILDDADGARVRLDPTSLTRCWHAAQLYRRAGKCRVLLSGGKTDWAVPGPTLAEAMQAVVIPMGIDAQDIVLEKKSATTYENALYSQPLLNHDGGRRIWLVTSAAHMGRAAGCFRKQGVAVTPAPCDHQTVVWQTSLTDFVPALGGLEQFTRAVHEWQGYVWYRLRGRI